MNRGFLMPAASPGRGRPGASASAERSTDRCAAFAPQARGLFSVNPASVHWRASSSGWFSRQSPRTGSPVFRRCEHEAPTANASSGLLARFSPHLELSMQGEPPSVQCPCCREVIIEGPEQLPLQQECSAG
jgi:hypothetical protein